MINWILQKNLTKPEILKRIKTVLNGEDEIWEEVDIIPFSNEIPEIKNKDTFKIIYGSTTFMLNAYQSEELREGVFFEPIKFQMTNYVDKWKDKVLNFDGKLMRFGEIENMKSEQEKKWFIRPNNDGKEFSGKVESFKKIVNWSNKVCQLELPEFNRDTEIWISEPKEITKEWRLFIVNNEIVSASRYMNDGQLDESENDIPKEMIEFAQERIDEYRLEDIYVMDIAEIQNEYKLIECNCFNGTGFYKHNVERIIQSINNFVKRKIKRKPEANNA
ncbi:ATP-grasp domain-containing protein [Neolewinella lacunae]|uniref:ATP-grasp domain-containing protein n=1 Tax=Neolewinella lacunae TaxID=1517758 RepID=A0A923T8S5_9BACT|nr:ATP-grasp domain-containing protein [Neolewinella lacunae]MBC6994841.1 ATP-grasp domain-containing protein [Neolewinella lacunae]MDN3635946.1 ATP-grasp domain-containing protein [Neolewinella lacunae]